MFVLNFAGDDIPHTLKSWTTLLRYGENAWIRNVEEEAAYVSTSGTSGLPKAAVLGHGYLVSQGDILEKMVSSEMNEVRVYFLVVE